MAEDIYDILQDYYNQPKDTRIATFLENCYENELRRGEERSIAQAHTASRTITEGTRKIGLSSDNREHIVEEGERNTDARDSENRPKPSDLNVGGGQFTVESGKKFRNLGLEEGVDCSYPKKRKRQIDGTSGGQRFKNSDLRPENRNDQDDNMASLSEQQQVED